MLIIKLYAFHYCAPFFSLVLGAFSISLVWDVFSDENESILRFYDLITLFEIALSTLWLLLMDF